jgi:hypothetical protein
MTEEAGCNSAPVIVLLDDNATSAERSVFGASLAM